MTKAPRAGFVIKNTPFGDTFHPSVVFTCGICEAEHAERFPGGDLSPDHAAKRARRRGWTVETDKFGSNRCPSCISTRQEAARGERAEKVTPIHNQPNRESVVVLHRNRGPAQAPALPSAEEIATRRPTPDQRTKIREALEAYFESKAGHFTHGYSDEKIAQELKLPRVFVEEIREVGFGPIRSDPELDALKAAIAAAQKQVTEATEKVALAQLEVEELKGRFEALEQKRRAA